MDAQTIGLVATGLVIGAISGLIGIGGAVILVPTLVPCGYSSVEARPAWRARATHRDLRCRSTTSRFADVRAAVLIASGFVFGALSAALICHIPRRLKRAFAAVLGTAAQLCSQTRIDSAPCCLGRRAAASCNVYGFSVSSGEDQRRATETTAPADDDVDSTFERRLVPKLRCPIRSDRQEGDAAAGNDHNAPGELGRNVTTASTR
jgi:hypothetical protein